MTTTPLRTLVRLIHLLGAAALGTFAYSPWRELPGFLDAVRWGLFPALAASGLWLWLGARGLARWRAAQRGRPLQAPGVSRPAPLDARH